ncbi:MAG: NADH-quinone oxidoreductase subunit J [Verrucomicrobiales bacterium]
MPVLFYIFSAIALVFGAMVVVLRNPVSSALSLVMSFVGVAALFVLLDAYFIGTIQILVYAGAVMVLFLFIIMLLDLKAEARRKLNFVAFGGGVLITVAFAIQIYMVLESFGPGAQKLADAKLDLPAASAANAEGLTPSIHETLQSGSLPDTKIIGHVLFTDYLFHIQVVAVLLLVATLGVVILSKKQLK